MDLRCVGSIELIGYQKNGKKKKEKIHILEIFGSCVPVHLECVPKHPSRTQSVPVHVRGVPVHPVLLSMFRPVFVFWT